MMRLTLALIAALSFFNCALAQPLNRIVAVVNDDVILESELIQRTRLVTENLSEQQTRLPPAQQLERQVLERIIVERLQLQLADQNNIQVDDETLNASLRQVAQQNGMTLTEFREVLEAENGGYAAFRDDFRNQIRINRLRQQMVGNRINITEQEVDNLLASQTAFGDQGLTYRLGHILVATPEAASPEEIQAASRKVQTLLERLQQGADFAQTAVAESDGQNALQGGDLGWRSAAQLPSLFAEPIRNMKAGEVSEPIRSPSGFHIIKLFEIKGDERRIVKQTHARHILITPDQLISNAGALERLLQLKNRIEGGEDFATLARSHSHDKVSASKGGDLGWVNPGDLVPPFEEAMDKLSVNQLSEPVRSQFGWHLIQVLERRSHDSTADFQRAQARDLIRKRKTDEELELWLRRLRDEAYVEYRIDS